MPRLLVFAIGVALTTSLAASASAQRSRALGPADGNDLPPLDTGRVAIGALAPDFALQSLVGDTVTLSDYRGKKNVVLIFYRGHW